MRCHGDIEYIDLITSRLQLYDMSKCDNFRSVYVLVEIDDAMLATIRLAVLAEVDFRWFSRFHIIYSG